MQKFFIVLTVVMAAFTCWCGITNQPIETKLINLGSTLLSYELSRLYRKRKQEDG